MRTMAEIPDYDQIAAAVRALAAAHVPTRVQLERESVEPARRNGAEPPPPPATDGPNVKLLITCVDVSPPSLPVNPT